MSVEARGGSEDEARGRIARVIGSISPLDRIEAVHQADALAWVVGGADIWRTGKPDRPPKHLVAYFVLLDARRRQVLLVDHIKAGLWLPTGGHVEVGEEPWAAVLREHQEELGVPAEGTGFGDAPVFVTVTETRGAGQHTDVSLWFVAEGDAERKYDWDPGEFRAVGWFDVDRLLDPSASGFDPHMHRFIRKLQRLC